MLGSRRTVEGLSLTLVCGPDGSPERYDVTLPRRITLAFLSRAVDTVEPRGRFTKEGFAPVGLFADRLYPGVMAGHDLSPPDGEPRTWWGTVRMNRMPE